MTWSQEASRSFSDISDVNHFFCMLDPYTAYLMADDNGSIYKTDGSKIFQNPGATLSSPVTFSSIGDTTNFRYLSAEASPVTFDVVNEVKLLKAISAKTERIIVELKEKYDVLEKENEQLKAHMVVLQAFYDAKNELGLNA